MKVLDAVICVLSVAAVFLPLVVKLLGLTAACVGQKSWQGVVSLVARLMEQAEREISVGSERREWVLGMAMAAAKELGCEVDEDELGRVIDALCAMAKGVNVSGEAKEK